MSDLDDRLYTAAKLREQVRGELSGGEPTDSFAGLVEDPGESSVLSFVENVVARSDRVNSPSFRRSALGSIVGQQVASDAITRAMASGDDALLSHVVGVTERDISGNPIRLPLLLIDQIENNGAPAFITGAGNPETGKTNTMFLLVELYDLALDDDLLVLSNVRSWERSDIHVASAHDLAVSLLEHRDRPKFIVLDEGSTHLDARTNRREVATQFTPLAKRFAKIGVEAFGTVLHTGKDGHPEVKRLTTLAYWKKEKTTAEFFERWPSDADKPTDPVFAGSIDDLEKTSHYYDPDDAAPWSWNLRPDLFRKDLSWSELLSELVEVGPSED